MSASINSATDQLSAQHMSSSMTATAETAPPPPRIWVIQSDKAGDNAQLRVIADALPWPYDIKHIRVQDRFVLGKPKVAASLHHIDQAASDALSAPWPDLIITIGRRMSMVALWVQEQSAGRTKIVLLGMPKNEAGRFDLAVMSGQYQAKERGNVLGIAYPLQRVDEAAVIREGAIWKDHFQSLPRPLIAVLVGGLTKAVRFDAAIATQLAEDVRQLQHQTGGSLVVLTSRRTPAAVVDALALHLPADAILHRWSPAGGHNPYRGLLHLADRFVVTSDSLSMLMEIAWLGRPLAIYPLPQSLWMGDGVLGRMLDRLMALSGPRQLARWLAKAVNKLGFIAHHRDIGILHKQLVGDGLAVWFGDPFQLDGKRPPDELPQVIDRIVSLLR